MSIKLVVFDMAGTTVQDNDNVAISLVEAMRAKGFNININDVNLVMGLPKPEAIRIIIQKITGNNPTVEIINDIYQVFEDIMVAHYQHNPEICEIEGVTKTFVTLKENGIKIGIDTGFSRIVADTIMHRLRWLEKGLIDVSVTSNEVPNGRPYPDLIFRAMELTGITDVKEVAKVGDTISDLKEGNAAGCSLIIGIVGKANTYEELIAIPHTHIIHNITEVSKIILL